MRVLYIGNYDPGYGRNRVIVKGLAQNGAEVVQCNGGVTGGLMKFIRLIARYATRARGRFDIVIVAFPAQESMFLVRLLLTYRRLIHRVPIVIDMLTSHYEGYILDRQKYTPESMHAVWYKWIDRTAMQLADISIVDSHAARRFLAKEMRMPIEDIIAVFIGTDDSVLKPMPSDGHSGFLVHFHGNFIPLQGPSYIIEAANFLKHDLDFRFQIIGKGQLYDECRNAAKEYGLTNINWIDRIPYEDLPRYINAADVCLGTFGGTGKFHRCAPNKVYEYMACGKAIITGRSDALEKISNDGVNMVLCNAADGKDMADKIMLLKQDDALRARLGGRARQEFLDRYNPKQLMGHLLQELRDKQLLSL